MKKNLLKFNQSSTLSLIAIMIMVLFTACQKDGAEELKTEMETSPQEITIDENTTPTGDISINLEKVAERNSESANSRSATYLIYSTVVHVNAGSWKHLYYTYPQLPDPLVTKIEVEIRPIGGNPNLYIYGYDADKAYPWRMVRSSTNADFTPDRTSFRRTDMKSDEERIYMSVYGQTEATYEIIISGTTVDCVEYPAADQWILLDYNPVCGCDGNDYPNTSSATVAGITSWTNGPCNSLDGNWVNTNTNTRGITKMIISNGARQIHLFGSCHPTDCDWGMVNLYKNGNCYEATYYHGFATRYLKVHEMPDGNLKLTIFNDYHDSRPDRTDIHYFRK